MALVLFTFAVIFVEAKVLIGSRSQPCFFLVVLCALCKLCKCAVRCSSVFHLFRFVFFHMNKILIIGNWTFLNRFRIIYICITMHLRISCFPTTFNFLFGINKVSINQFKIHGRTAAAHNNDKEPNSSCILMCMMAYGSVLLCVSPLSRFFCPADCLLHS